MCFGREVPWVEQKEDKKEQQRSPSPQSPSSTLYGDEDHSAGMLEDEMS